jgi:hypothetical protein
MGVPWGIDRVKERLTGAELAQAIESWKPLCHNECCRRFRIPIGEGLYEFRYDGDADVVHVGTLDAPSVLLELGRLDTGDLTRSHAAFILESGVNVFFPTFTGREFTIVAPGHEYDGKRGGDLEFFARSLDPWVDALEADPDALPTLVEQAKLVRRAAHFALEHRLLISFGS